MEDKPQIQNDPKWRTNNCCLTITGPGFKNYPKTVSFDEVQLSLSDHVHVSGVLAQILYSDYYTPALVFANNDICSKTIKCNINYYKANNDDLVSLHNQEVTNLVIKAKSKAQVESGVHVRIECESNVKVIAFIREFRFGKDESISADQEMLKDISHTFEDDTFKDIKFVVGDESFMAHKFVITARSEVFHAMLLHDTKEKKEGVIEIKDVSMQALRSFVIFLYTNRVEGIEEKVVELLMLADKYNVQSLQDKCKDYMYANNIINETNSVSYLIKAHECKSKLLEKLALLNIRFHIKKILQSNDIDLLEDYPALMKEVVTILGDCQIDDVNSSADRLQIKY